MGLVTYEVKVSGIRSLDEIIKYALKAHADIGGAVTSRYWGIFMMVFMYDTIKPYLLNIISGSRGAVEVAIEEMVNEAADALLYINEE